MPKFVNHDHEKKFHLLGFVHNHHGFFWVAGSVETPDAYNIISFVLRSERTESFVVCCVSVVFLVLGENPSIARGDESCLLRYAQRINSPRWSP